MKEIMKEEVVVEVEVMEIRVMIIPVVLKTFKKCYIIKVHLMVQQDKVMEQKI